MTRSILTIDCMSLVIALSAGESSATVDLDELFENMSAHHMWKGDDDPLLYFVPYFESLLQGHISRQRYHARSHVLLVQETEITLKNMWQELLNLKRTKQSFERFIARTYRDAEKTSASQERLSGFISDCELQICDATHLMSHLKAEVQILQSKLAIQEAQKSLEQAASIRKWDYPEARAMPQEDTDFAQTHDGCFRLYTP